jgi:hypothetical protein
MRSNLFPPLKKSAKREGSQAGALTPPAGLPIWGGYTKILHGPGCLHQKVSTSTDTVPVLVNTNIAFSLPALLTASKAILDATFKI